MHIYLLKVCVVLWTFSSAVACGCANGQPKINKNPILRLERVEFCEQILEFYGNLCVQIPCGNLYFIVTHTSSLSEYINSVSDKTQYIDLEVTLSKSLFCLVLLFYESKITKQTPIRRSAHNRRLQYLMHWG